MSIHAFHPLVARWFENTFPAPSPPQAQGWPAIAAAQNTLILAPTGSGKTLAAFLWCIDELFCSGLEAEAKTFARNLNGIHTLYISPLKALNNDIHRNLQEPLKGIAREADAAGIAAPPIRVQVRTGDTPAAERAAMLRRPPHILITTPESLFLLLTSAKGRELFRNLRYVIIDEIHNISANKRGVHLSLSLERLEALCGQPPVRIGLSATQKPLQRIAAFMAGQTQDAQDLWTPRPVTIVDCGQRKEMDVRVIAPVPDYGELPESSVWPAVYEKLYALIRSHRTTLVFANMRAQTEKIARQLNEIHRRTTQSADGIIALAHHGSLSRETRFLIERRLKAGDIPAVVATASLELGIDIGSIDLVVQLEAPRSVASALQRVGRSGHLLSATSKGRIIPLYAADLDDCVATTLAMHAGEIEETRIPENCLDVLAQHIVAEVAMQPQQRHSLYQRLRGSYCFRALPEETFDRVVDMLAGRYARDDLKALQPRLSWDRVNDRLIARQGSRMLAVMNMGTIPDRAYYGVYLQDRKTRLGEVEEEFVFESRVGDHFFLGNNEWRILAIDRDKITVAPIETQKPRAPFWKGESLFRDLGIRQQVGRFRRQLIAQDFSPGEGAMTEIAEEAIWQNLGRFLARQQAHCGAVATDRQWVLESFNDAAGQPYLVLHAPLGARITGLWAIALAALLQKRYRMEVQYAYDDDCLVLRLPDAGEWPALDDLFRVPLDEFESLLRDALISTPLFSVRFRHNAARALLLPRSRPHKRIPLWLQRLRAADLLQAVRDSGDFPILLETYRDCLEDLFDWPGLRSVLQQLQNREIHLHECRTASPSPMAAGLLFRFLSANMYEYDRSRLPGQAANVSSELLAEILSRETIPTIVTAEAVAEAESRWQHTAPGFQARDAEELFALLDKLGALNHESLRLRCARDFQPWLETLRQSGRVICDQETGAWRVKPEASAAPEVPSQAVPEAWLRRHLAVRGPVTVGQLSEASGLPDERLHVALERLLAARHIVRGRLVVDAAETQYCNRDNYAELYRRAIAQRRRSDDPVTPAACQAFLLAWNGISAPFREPGQWIEHYRARLFMPRFFEAEILHGRQWSGAPGEALLHFEEAVRQGAVILFGRRAAGAERLRIGFFKRGEGAIFFTAAEWLRRTEALSGKERAVWQFLRENGASLMEDIESACDLSRLQTIAALRSLAEATLVSCDDYRAFVAIFSHAGGETAPPFAQSPWQSIKPGRRRQPGGRGERTATRRRVQNRLLAQRGRWFLLSSFAAMGKEKDAAAQAEAQARLLLLRYGILVKEWYRRENGLLPWPVLFHALKRLEWQGEIRRGYFVAGLSGVQFALPQALEQLCAGAGKNTGAALHLVSMMDPAFPFRNATDDAAETLPGKSALPARLHNNYLAFRSDGSLLAVIANHGAQINFSATPALTDVEALAGALKRLLTLPLSLRPRRCLKIDFIDAAAASASPWAQAFTSQGYKKEENGLILWPSDL